MIRAAALAGAFAAGIGAGAAAVWNVRPAAAPPPPGCRPSAPTVAAAQAGHPVVLFFGNSLLYDHGWRIRGATAVNCARQGLTAAAAHTRIPALPDVAPRAVVLGFGSVEAVRAGRTGQSVDAPAFEAAIARIAGSVRQRWPMTAILWMPVPELPSVAVAPAPVRLSDARALNVAIARLAATSDAQRFLTPAAIAAYALEPSVAQSYDGVHLTIAWYEVLEAALAAALAEQRENKSH